MLRETSQAEAFALGRGGPPSSRKAFRTLLSARVGATPSDCGRVHRSLRNTEASSRAAQATAFAKLS